MKWIGQHIWDYYTRFRNDVYMDAVESGTVASGGNLGLDANNKIVKTTSDNLSFDGSTANGILTYKDADEISVEPTLTYNPSVTQEYFQPFEPDYDNALLTIGIANNSAWDMGPTITTADATSGNKAKGLRLRSGASSGTNKSGSPVTITSGIGTGSSQPTILDVEGPDIGSSGTTANEPVPTLKLWKAVNGTYGKSTIFQIFDPGCTDITNNNLSFYVNDDADDCVIQARKHNGAAKLTLDVDGDIDINADGGNINFKDGANQLAKINTNGLSFVDNTGAGIIFEGSTDDAYNTTLTAADTTGSSKTITLPNATGTVALTSDIPTVPRSIMAAAQPNTMLIYLYKGSTWQGANGSFQLDYGSGSVPNTGDTGATLAQQALVPIVHAISNMTVYKVTMNWYWTTKYGSIQGARNFEFAFHSATALNNSQAEQTLSSQIVTTNNNGTFTNERQYITTWEFASGGGYPLSAGDNLNIFARNTSFSSTTTITSPIIGQIWIEYKYN